MPRPLSNDRTANHPSRCVVAIHLDRRSQLAPPHSLMLVRTFFPIFYCSLLDHVEVINGLNRRIRHQITVSMSPLLLLMSVCYLKLRAQTLLQTTQMMPMAQSRTKAKSRRNKSQSRAKSPRGISPDIPHVGAIPFAVSNQEGWSETWMISFWWQVMIRRMRKCIPLVLEERRGTEYW